MISVGRHVKTVDGRFGKVIGKARWWPVHDCWVWENFHMRADKGPWVVEIQGLFQGYPADDLSIVERSRA